MPSPDPTPDDPHDKEAKEEMAGFTAKDVQALRQATGAGMLDAKKALEANDGDSEKAAIWLREKGLASSAKREDRENAQGAVAIVRAGNVAAVAELKCETDFVAKSDAFVNLANDLADAVVSKGLDAVGDFSTVVDELKVTLKENIAVGRVERFEAAPGNMLDTYLHVQSGRGVNGVLVELAGGTQELAHDLAVHIAFGRPSYITRDEVPAEDVAAERATLEAQTRNEGKPEAALTKIVEGKLNAFYADRVLLDQAFAKDDKRKVAQVLGDATVVRFAQVVIGA
ncbi:MAG TPA: translation elongation factor Ts [Acidimicrobiales bacterium]|nr:translation elongation factor Ts [Acidimicrobiales bacterium]